ncbi:MAG: hypothetical protein JWN85_3732 [Gammaproteobacteria bacterium]|nr:hypothetical protein [Gammaproteobacteria bacterium]
MQSFLIRGATLPLLLLAAGVEAASAAPPADSAYSTDPQSSYVQDATSESIGSVNMITCIMHSMRPDALVNQGPYAALIDKNVCDATKSGGASSGASASAAQAPTYMNAVVDSTRASNTDPMIVKAWISLNEGGQAVTVFAHISATEAPSTANPYGAFRMDYCGVPAGGGACMMNGFLQGGSGALSYYEASSNQDGSGVTALQLTSVGTTSGSGSVSVQNSGGGGSSSSAYNFAYDQSYFLRADSQNGSECFSRDAADPATGLAVWQYGLYDATTGARIVRNSGFPIQYTHGGTTYQGYLGYYGLSLPPDAAATLVTGSTVQKVDYQNGAAPLKTDYSVIVAGGRLTRYKRQARTLKDIDQIHFNVYVNDKGSSGLPNSNTQYETYWDDASGKFLATGAMQCGQNGCSSTTFTNAVAVDASFWASVGGVQGWSQSLGGDLFINLRDVTGAVDASTSSTVTVVYHVQDLVYPDDSTKPATLYCVNNCPTAASLQSYFTQTSGNSVQSPYITATSNNFQPVQIGGVATYTVDANAQLSGGDGTTAAAVYTDPTAYQQFQQYQNGVSSGRLFTTLADAQCNASPVEYCDWAVNSADAYYMWQTGPNTWNQFSAVRDSAGSFVHFDAPLQVNFKVPAGTSYGSYGGTSLILQYNNFGDLWGIPGSCVSPTTNAPVDCSTPNSRYVPEFVIPYDPAASPQQGVVTTTSSGVTTSYLVKWLQREIRFAVKDATVCTNDHLQAPVNVQLPTAAGLKDPSSSSSDIYLGAEPTVTSAPRVIQGDVKY